MRASVRGHFIEEALSRISSNFDSRLFGAQLGMPSKNVSLYSSRRPHDLSVPRVNITTFGLKSIQYG